MAASSRRASSTRRLGRPNRSNSLLRVLFSTLRLLAGLRPRPCAGWYVVFVLRIHNAQITRKPELRLVELVDVPNVLSLSLRQCRLRLGNRKIVIHARLEAVRCLFESLCR